MYTINIFLKVTFLFVYGEPWQEKPSARHITRVGHQCVEELAEFGRLSMLRYDSLLVNMATPGTRATIHMEILVFVLHCGFETSTKSQQYSSM